MWNWVNMILCPFLIFMQFSVGDMKYGSSSGPLLNLTFIFQQTNVVYMQQLGF